MCFICPFSQHFLVVSKRLLILPSFDGLTVHSMNGLSSLWEHTAVCCHKALLTNHLQEVPICSWVERGTFSVNTLPKDAMAATQPASSFDPPDFWSKVLRSNHCATTTKI